jgi:hypothetical protein
MGGGRDAVAACADTGGTVAPEDALLAGVARMALIATAIAVGFSTILHAVDARYRSGPHSRCGSGCASDTFERRLVAVSTLAIHTNKAVFTKVASVAAAATVFVGLVAILIAVEAEGRGGLHSGSRCVPAESANAAVADAAHAVVVAIALLPGATARTVPPAAVDVGLELVGLAVGAPIRSSEAKNRELCGDVAFATEPAEFAALEELRVAAAKRCHGLDQVVRTLRLQVLPMSVGSPHIGVCNSDEEAHFRRSLDETTSRRVHRKGTAHTDVAVGHGRVAITNQCAGLRSLHAVELADVEMSGEAMLLPKVQHHAAFLPANILLAVADAPDVRLQDRVASRAIAEEPEEIALADLDLDQSTAKADSLELPPTPRTVLTAVVRDGENGAALGNRAGGVFARVFDSVGAGGGLDNSHINRRRSSRTGTFNRNACRCLAVVGAGAGVLVDRDRVPGLASARAATHIGADVTRAVYEKRVEIIVRRVGIRGIRDPVLMLEAAMYRKRGKSVVSDDHLTNTLRLLVALVRALIRYSVFAADMYVNGVAHCRRRDCAWVDGGFAALSITAPNGVVHIDADCASIGVRLTTLLSSAAATSWLAALCVGADLGVFRGARCVEDARAVCRSEVEECTCRCVL